MSFLDNVLQLCEQRGEKLTPLMKQLELSPGNVQRWRDGATVNSKILMDFSNHFGVSVDFLLNGKEYVSPDNYKKQCSSPEEIELLAMFRSIPDYAKEIVLGSLRAAYDAEMRRQEEEKRLLG
ncbi:hypothetical protein NSB25_11575 [Acetatifactor muris]|uniref:HTH cro/C1-type domain-containing protein n=1 Tax=Acetatifactor muris TaxID=879566 RepID=A0A2K4ZH23_9FIRM|nr:hypothetical protein [Acetatifactor muris]MCR2047925.1 hypothetical protein [Acetatifactor muris]SOY29726.1 hypothetical protein AMURIS_02447 [Acetatifactor muris]